MAKPDVVGTIPPDADSAKIATVKTPEKDSGPKPTKTLPTTRVGFAKQLTMLRSYAELGADAPVGNTAVAELVGIHPNTAILANPFFVDVGFIQKVGQGYIASPEVVAYHRAVEWNPDTAPMKLAPLLARTWFGRRILPKLSLATMSETQAIQAFAEEAAASPKYASQLGLLLDYLAIAGLIRHEGGIISKGGAAPTEDAPMQNESSPKREADEPAQPARRAPAITTAFSQAPEGVLRFNVDVSVDMKEFATWQPERISRFWAGIAQVLAAKAEVEGKGPRD